MALKLVRSDRANAIGGFIPKWYGSYRDGGKVKTVALGVALRGRPPASGDLAEQGDAKFELSRQKAQAKLDALMEKSKERVMPYGRRGITSRRRSVSGSRIPRWIGWRRFFLLGRKRRRRMWR